MFTIHMKITLYWKTILFCINKDLPLRNVNLQQPKNIFSKPFLCKLSYIIQNTLEGNKSDFVNSYIPTQIPEED